LFWGTLGGLVALNVQLDARRHPARRMRAACGRTGARELAVRAAKVAGTFTTIALLWSLWSSPSLGAWLDMLGRGLRGAASFPRVEALLELIRRGAYGG
jgi:hypothetical protein